MRAAGAAAHGFRARRQGRVAHVTMDRDKAMATEWGRSASHQDSGAGSLVLSFSFKTAAQARGNNVRMTTDRACPVRSHAAPAPQASHHPKGTWPPGPARFTGWSLLRELSRDPLSSLSRWQREFGDVVHL